MTYRLNESDERVLVRGARRDLRGDVGVCSSAGQLEQASMCVPIGNFEPFSYWHAERGQYSRTQDVGFRCGALVVAVHRYPRVPHDVGDALLATSAGDRLFLACVEHVGPLRFVALQRAYCDAFPGGLETFDDVAPLAADTAAASICLTREQGTAGRALSLHEALGRLSRRCGPHPAPGQERSEADLALFGAIYEEADARLSRACRAWTAALRDARRANEIARAA